MFSVRILVALRTSMTGMQVPQRRGTIQRSVTVQYSGDKNVLEDL